MVGSISIETLQRKRLHLGSTNRKFLMKVGQREGEENRGVEEERERERSGFPGRKGKSGEEGERGRVISDILLQLGIRKRRAKRGRRGGLLFVAAFN